MATVHSAPRRSLRVDGPFLMPFDALVALEKRIHGFEEEGQLHVRTEATLLLKGDLVVTGESIESLDAKATRTVAMPQELTIHVEIGEPSNPAKVSATIEMDKNSLSFDVPQLLDKADSVLLRQTRDQLIDLLMSWAEEVRPSWFIRNQSWLRPFTVCAPIGVLLGVVLGSVDNGEIQFKQQARQLLENGLSQEESQKAIELLLQHFSHSFPRAPWHLPMSGSIWVFAIAIIGIVVSIGPNNSRIGLGTGKVSVKRWEKWFKAVYTVIPLTIVSAIATQLILSALGLS